MKTEIEILQAIEATLRKCRSKNQPAANGVYPVGSLHESGVLLCTCPTCCTRAALLWVTGYPEETTGVARIRPEITEEEMAKADNLTKRYETSYQSEGKVNDW